MTNYYNSLVSRTEVTSKKSKFANGYWQYSLMILFSLFLGQTVFSQSASNYVFSQTAGTYADVIGTASTAAGDDGTQINIPIGFSFSFEGIAYTAFGITTNGAMKLGATAAPSFTNALSNTATARPLIAAIWDDNHKNTGVITYTTSGTAPNRVLSVSWKNVNIGGGGAISATLLASYRIDLTETINTIDITYGSLAAAGTLSASIGINGTGSYLSVTPTATTATTSSTVANNAVAATALPNMTGKRYRFTPPPPPSIDLASTAVVGVPASGCPGASAPLSVTIINNSTLAIHDFAVNPATVTIAITGAATQTLTTTVSSGTLAIGASQTVLLAPNASFTLGGTYNLAATVTVVGDGNAGNNSFTATPKVIATPAVASGYTQDFNAATTTPAGWNTTGFIIAATHGQTGNGLYRNIYSLAPTGQFSTISVGPVSATDELKFDYRIVNFTSYPATATPAGWGNFQVQVSTDCGGTFTTVQTVNDANHIVGLGWAGKVIPLGAYVGQNVLVRVLATWVAGDYYLDFDNFSIAPIPVTPPNCATALIPVNLAIDVVRNSSFSWTASTGSPLSYDVYFGTTPAPSFVANVLSTTYTPALMAANTTYYWKVVAKNNNGDAVGCVEQSFTTGSTITYCTPVYTSGKILGDLISNIAITGTTLANNSGTAQTNPAYTFFTGAPNLTGNLQAGSTYSVNVTVGTWGNQHIKAWIDYNDNGTFEASESIGAAVIAAGQAQTGPFPAASFSITLACNPPLGVHRLRVRDVWSTTTGFFNTVDPCNSQGYGETEDYLVNVTTADPCPAPSALTAVTTSSSASLNWAIGCAETAWEVVVQAPATGLPTGAGVAVSAKPYALSALTELTSYEYYVRAVCDAGLGVYSTWAGPFVFTTLANAPGCATAVSPANGATGVVIASGAAAITWTAPAVTSTEGAAVTYGVHFGTSAGTVAVPLPLIGSITAPAAAVNITGLAFNTTYYFRIAPTNTGGINATCTEFSFTTQPDPCVGVVAPGSTFANAIDLGAITASQTISGNNLGGSCFKDNFTATSTPGAANARPGKDVFYKFQITELCNNLILGTCAPTTPVSTLTDTFVHLLDATGTVIAFDDDSCPATGVDAGSLIDGLTAAVTTGFRLPIGTYYVVVEGYTVTQEGTFNLDFNYSSVPAVNYYTDADGDGFGDVNAVAQPACAPVAGKVTNNTDCIDNNSTANPLANEVAYDGIDNNCNGELDEGFPSLNSQIVSSTCNTTLSSINSTIYISSLPASAGITNYRFRVKIGATGTPQFYETTNLYMKLTNLSSYLYATTYTIDVELKRGGVWLGYYGESCNVTSPNIPLLLGTSCSSTIINQFTGIYTSALPGVTSYKFRITNLTSGIIEEETNIYNWFNFNMLDGFVYGTTYSVEVAVKTTGTNYTAYGAPCNVSTPAVPGLLATSCGATINSNTAGIYTTYLNNVTTYRFELSNPTTGTVVQVIDRATNWFNFSQVTGHVAGTSYSVRLKLLTKGVYSDWGPSCTINPGAGAAARFGSATTVSSTGTEFKAVGYPNPFESNFTLNVTTASDEKVQVAVYDMIGKQLELKEVNAADATALEVGANYPSGVYNVVVSQGANVKSLRMIKR